MTLFNLDFAKSYQLLFQDPATPIMEGIVDLHHNIFFFLLLILVLVLYVLFSFLDKFCSSWISPNKSTINLYHKNFLVLNSLLHGTKLEVIWTLIPSFICY